MKLTPADVSQWYKVITDFPNYYANFQRNFSALVTQAPYIHSKHPELLPEYNRLLASGNETYSKLYTLNNQIQTLKGVFARAGTTITDWLSSARSKIYGWMGLGELGIVPIIWAGMSAGAAIGLLVAVGNWLTETKTFAMRVEEAKRLEAQGRSPEEVTRILTGRYGSPGTGGTLFGFPVKLIFMGILGLIALPIIVNAFAGRRK